MDKIKTIQKALAAYSAFLYRSRYGVDQGGLAVNNAGGVHARNREMRPSIINKPVYIVTLLVPHSVALSIIKWKGANHMLRWLGKYFYFIILALLAIFFLVVMGQRMLSL